MKTTPRKAKTNHGYSRARIPHHPTLAHRSSLVARRSPLTTALPPAAHLKRALVAPVGPDGKAGLLATARAPRQVHRPIGVFVRAAIGVGAPEEQPKKWAGTGHLPTLPRRTLTRRPGQTTRPRRGARQAGDFNDVSASVHASDIGSGIGPGLAKDLEFCYKRVVPGV
jgi:hypothetical protein